MKWKTSFDTRCPPASDVGDDDFDDSGGGGTLVCVWGGGIEFNVICRRANKKKSACRQQRECGWKKIEEQRWGKDC